MILLPSNIVTEGANTMKPALTYAGALLGSLDGMLASVQSISPTIDRAVATINDVVNITSMNQDLQCLQSLTSVPEPAVTASTLQRLDTELQTGLQRAQNLSATMQAVLALSPAMTAISSAAPDLQAIQGQLSSYSLAVGSLPDVDPGKGSSVIASLSDAQSSVQAQQQSWADTIATLSSSILAIQTARSSHTLVSLADQSTQLYDSVQPSAPLQQQVLPQAVAALQALRQALNLASPALTCATRFAATLRRINTTLAAFPPGPATTALQNLTAVETALQQLLQGTNSTAGLTAGVSLSDPGATLDRLLQALQDLPARVQGAPDPSQLADTARKSDDMLQLMPDPTTLLGQVSQIQAALAALSNAANTLGPRLTAYQASSTSASYASLLQAARQAQPLAADAASALSQVQSPAAAAASVVALVQPTVQDLLQLVSKETNYVTTLQSQLAGYPTNVSSLLDTLNSLEPAWQAATQAQSQDNGAQSVMTWVQNVVNTAMDTAQSAQRQVQQSLAAFGSSAELHDVLDQATDIEATYEEQGDKWWGQYAWKAWLGIYALLIALVLITFIMVFIVCPGGLLLSLALCLVYLTLFLVLALALSGGLVVGQDSCWAAERIVVAEVSAPTTRVLLSYYLYSNSSQSLSSVLQQANIVDINQVQSSLNSTTDQVAWLTGNYTLGSSLQPSVASIQATLTGVQSALTSLLARAAHDPVHGYYLSIKSFACCDAATDVFVQWVCMAAAGLLVIAMAVAQLVVLGRLDVLPRKNCCGFQCYFTSDYPPREDGDAVPSSAADSLGGRDLNDTSYPDQLMGRGSQHGTPRYGPHSPSNAKLSFHYFGPPPTSSQKHGGSREGSLRGAQPAAMAAQAVLRDTAHRDAPGRFGDGALPPPRAGSSTVGAARQEPGGNGGGSRMGYPAAAAAGYDQRGDRAGMYLPPPPYQYQVPSVPASPAVRAPSAVASRRQDSAGLSTTPSGTVLWYGEPAVGPRGSTQGRNV